MQDLCNIQVGVLCDYTYRLKTFKFVPNISPYLSTTDFFRTCNVKKGQRIMLCEMNLFFLYSTQFGLDLLLYKNHSIELPYKSMAIIGSTSFKTVKSVKPNLIFLYPLKTQKHLGLFWMCSVDIDIQHSEEIG